MILSTRNILLLLTLFAPLAKAVPQKRVSREAIQDSIQQRMIRADENLKTRPAVSEKSALEAYHLAIELKDVRVQAKISFLLGKIYFFLHKDELSLQAFNHAADLFLEESDSTQAALALNGSGNVFLQKKKNFTEALKRYDRALQLLHRDSVTAIRVLNNIGTIYNRTNRYEEALQIYERVYHVAETQKDLLNMSASLNNIGSVYDHLGNFQASVSYYLKAIEIKEAYNDYAGIANTLTNLGIAYSQLKKYKESEEVLVRALALAHEYSFTDTEIYLKIVLSDLYAQTTRPTLALGSVEEAERMARSTGVSLHNGSIYKKLSEMYRLTGEMELALKYQQKFATFNDSLTRVERTAAASLVTGNEMRQPSSSSESSGRQWHWSIWTSFLAVMILLTWVVVRKRSTN